MFKKEKKCSFVTRLPSQGNVTKLDLYSFRKDFVVLEKEKLGARGCTEIALD